MLLGLLVRGGCRGRYRMDMWMTGRLDDIPEISDPPPGWTVVRPWTAIRGGPSVGRFFSGTDDHRAALIRYELCDEAIHICRTLVELLPGNNSYADAYGLLALMLLILISILNRL